MLGITTFVVAITFVLMSTNRESRDEILRYTTFHVCYIGGCRCMLLAKCSLVEKVREHI